jgi:hypothetical protein
MAAVTRTLAGRRLLLAVWLAAGLGPVVSQTLGPAWGYHVHDVGLGLGDLVRDVAGEEAAWATAHH